MMSSRAVVVGCLACRGRADIGRPRMESVILKMKEVMRV